MNVQRSVVFLHTNKQLSERETKKTIPFTIASKRIKYLGINLTEDVKDLYLENYMTLKKEIEEETNNWKHIPCSWIGRINIIKMFTLPKTIYKVNVIAIKIPMTYFTELEQIFQKIYMEPKKAPHSNSIPEKDEQSWWNCTRIPNIKQYYKATVIKTAWYWHKNRHIDQWDRIESPEINQFLTVN